LRSEVEDVTQTPVRLRVVASRGEPEGVVPEADRQEQELPADPDPRRGHDHPPEEPEADVLEQEIPAADDDAGPAGVDAERVEPLDDEER
jgi:hypothetical protein